MVEKLTDKSPLLPLYRTVHEIFTSYGSSFNSFEVIGSFSAFENQKDPFQVWICSFGIGICVLLLHFYLLNLLIFDFSLSFPFHHSLSPIGLILDPFSHWATGTKSKINQIDFSIKSTMWNPRFFLFLYPYRYSVWINREPFLLYESILLHSNSFLIPPRKILNWIPNWRVSVSLSMRLCILRIGIHFLKDPGFRALVGLRDPFDDLCCVEGISIEPDLIRSIA